LREKYAFLLVTDVKWWNRLCDRNHEGKRIHAFVRKSLVGPKKATLLLFYVKYPAKEVRGIGEFIERVAGNAEELWSKHGVETCLESHSEYKEFMQGREKATFIRFKNLRQLPTAMPFETLAKRVGVARVPRGGKYLSKEIVNQLL